jgi:Ser/Thr protein kinase RdoA (MazF antagonist)
VTPKGPVRWNARLAWHLYGAAADARDDGIEQALLEAGQQRQALAARVGEVVGKLHRAGWVHGALYSDHVLVGNGAEAVVHLIDFEKAARNPLRRAGDLERFWRRNDYFTDSDRLAFETAYVRARRG